MAAIFQDSIPARTAMLAALAAIYGTATKLRVYKGTMPADCAASLGSATMIAEGTLPDPYFGTAASGTIAKAGTWTLTGSAGAAADVGTFFRWYKSDGTTCVNQGNFGVGAFAMTPDVNSITAGQTVTITGYTRTRSNA